MQDIIIYGYGSFAKLLKQFIEWDSNFRVIGYVVDPEFLPRDGETTDPVYSVEDLPVKFPPSECALIVAIGYKNMRNRSRVYESASAMGYRLVSYVSSTATVFENASIGSNAIILPNVVVEPNVVIGDNVIIWSNSTICHDAVVGNHNFIASNTTIGGNVVTGDHCFLGFSSTILQNVAIAEDCCVGANSLVTQNSLPGGRYVGSPARVTSIAESGQCIFDH